MNVRYPCNADDESMSLSAAIPNHPLSTPTIMSVFLQRIKLATICREIVDTLPPMVGDMSEPAYDVILSLDKQLHDMLHRLPDFFKIDYENVSEDQPAFAEKPYLLWQRISVHFSIHARLCRLHRSHHVQSLTNTIYSYSRVTSVHSAYRILQLGHMMDDLDGPAKFRPERSWVILQHITMASLTLATDASLNPDSPGAIHMRDRVMAAYEILRRSNKDQTKDHNPLSRELKRICKR